MATISEALAVGARHRQSGRFDLAEPVYQQILKASPNHPVATHYAGLVAFELGREQSAIELLERSIALNPLEPIFHGNLGVILYKRGKSDEAIASYKRALQIKPDFADAHNNLGNALRSQGKLEEAAASCRWALQIKPDYAAAHNDLGVVLFDQSQLDEAVACYRRALQINPDYADAHNNLGNALRSHGKLEEAVESYRRALQINPEYAEAHNNLGVSLSIQGASDEAIASFRQALHINPDYAKAHNNLGNALRSQGRAEEAIACYRRSLEIKPSDTVRLALAVVLPVIYQSNDEVDFCRKRFCENVTRLSQDGIQFDLDRDDFDSSVFYSAYQGRNDREIQEMLGRLCGSAAKDFTRSYGRHGVTGSRIRVGFISAFLRNHTIGQLCRGIIANLSRQQFHVTMLAIGGCHESLDHHLIKASADSYIEVPTDLSTARQRICDENLDILFYTDVGMHPASFALALSRLATVQCVTWGHPVTTGVSTMDYFISSKLLEIDDADDHYTEELVRLETLPTFYYFPQRSSPAKTRGDFGIDDNVNIYLCPQSLFKIHPDFDRLLAGILQADPNGRAVFIDAPKRQWTQLLRQRLGRTIPDHAAQIQFIPRQHTVDFLHLMSVSNVMLDPVHFGGGNTSYEALAVGTPIVTLPSEFMRGRVTYACYRKMGFMDCVAKDPDDYIQIAVRVGSDPDYRQQMKREIESSNHVLYEDTDAVRELERFFIQAVTRAASEEQ